MIDEGIISRCFCKKNYLLDINVLWGVNLKKCKLNTCGNTSNFSWFFKEIKTWYNRSAPWLLHHIFIFLKSENK